MAAYKDASSAGVPGSNSTFQMDKFVPTLWSSRILKNLHDKQILKNFTTGDYAGELKGKGDTVKIHGVGSIAVKPYLTNLDNGNSVIYDLPTDQELIIEIDAASYFAFKVEDIEATQADPKFLSELTAEAAVSLAKTSDQYIYNKMYDAAVNDTADGFGQRGASSTTNGGITEVDMSSSKATLYNALVNCGTRLDDMLCPDDGRFIVLPSFARGALLQDDRFVAYNSAGQAQARDKGLIGTVAGFEVYTMPISSFVRWDDSGASNDYEEANAVGDLGIVTGSTADDYSAIYGRKGAMAYVEQINKVENLRLEGYFADAVRGLWMAGGGVIRPQFLGVLEMDDYRVTDA